MENKEQKAETPILKMENQSMKPAEQLLQMLAKENAEMKADIKLLKTEVYAVTDALKITIDKQFNPKFSVGSLMTTVSGIIASQMMGTEDKRFSGLKNLLPIIEKYKDL